MKISIEENSVNLVDLKKKLEEKFPDYQFLQRNKKMLVAKKSSTAGANIIVYKKRIMVGGAFPTMGGQMLFALSIFLLGILIPIIVYLAAFRPKQRELENEIGDFIKLETAP